MTINSSHPALKSIINNIVFAFKKIFLMGKALWSYVFDVVSIKRTGTPYLSVQHGVWCFDLGLELSSSLTNTFAIASPFRADLGVGTPCLDIA